MTLDDMNLAITRCGGRVARVNASVQGVDAWRVPLSEIRGVVRKPPTRLLNGWIHARTAESPDAPVPTTGTAAKLLDTVLFTWSQRETYAAALAALSDVTGPQNLKSM